MVCLESIDCLCLFSSGKPASVRLLCHLQVLSAGNHAQSLVTQKSEKGKTENKTCMNQCLSLMCMMLINGQLLSQKRREELVGSESFTRSCMKASSVCLQATPSREQKKLTVLWIVWNRMEIWRVTLVNFVLLNYWLRSFFSPSKMFSFSLFYHGNFYGQSHYIL